MNEFPITPQAVLTLLGMTALVTVATAIVRQWVTDKRWVNLIAIGIGFLIAIVATYAVYGGYTVSNVLEALLLALAAGAGASGLWELGTNLLGKAGVGDRSDAGLMLKTLEAFKSDGPTHAVIVQAVRKELKLP